jgi:hypothetical protein
MRRPRRPSVATVVAFVALFVVLAQSNAVAGLAGTITGRDVRNGSLTGKDMQRGSVGGRVLKESSVGKVPKARNADRVGGRTADSLRLRCAAADTRLIAQLCVELASRNPAPYTTAANDCKVAGRRLPTHDELMTALNEPGFSLGAGGELTRNVYPAGGPGRKVDVLYITNSSGDALTTPDNAEGAKRFRCVVNPAQGG